MSHLWQSVPQTVATKTTAPNTRSGIYGLPFSNKTITNSDKINPGDMQRLEFDLTTSPYQSIHNIRQGDVILSTRNDRNLKSTIYYVESTTPETLTLQPELPENNNSTVHIDHIQEAIHTNTILQVASDITPEEYTWIALDLYGNHPKYDQTTAHKDINNLVLTREESHETVTKFLNHPIVNHKLGRTYLNCQRKATFGARYQSADGPLIAVVELTIPASRILGNTGKYIELRRFGSHPHRPESTGSWLISRALEWAKLEGYEICNSYAGVNENPGTLYTALGFTQAYTDQTAVGDGWNSADSRNGRNEVSNYSRAKYLKQLHPEITGIHRRKLTKTDENETTLFDYGKRYDLEDKHNISIDPTTNTVKQELIEERSLASDSDAIWFVRRDDSPEAMKSVLEDYGNQCQHKATQISIDHVFAETTKTGISSLATVTTIDTDTPKAIISGYGTVRDTDAKNTASILISKIRKWAGLSGFKTITCNPSPNTHIEAALKQSGFNNKPATQQRKKKTDTRRISQ